MGKPQRLPFRPATIILVLCAGLVMPAGMAQAQQAQSQAGSQTQTAPPSDGPAPAQPQDQNSGPDAPSGPGLLQAEPAPAIPPPAPAGPGLFGNLNQIFDPSLNGVGSSLKGMQDTLNQLNSGAAQGTADVAKGAADVTRGAVDAVTRLPVARVVSGHKACALAPNGAPDCRGAAAALCQAKGFSDGNSIDTVSARKCPTDVWLARRQPKPGECTNETFITRAMCQ